MVAGWKDWVVEKSEVSFLWPCRAGDSFIIESKGPWTPSRPNLKLHDQLSKVRPEESRCAKDDQYLSVQWHDSRATSRNPIFGSLPQPIRLPGSAYPNRSTPLPPTSKLQVEYACSIGEEVLDLAAALPFLDSPTSFGSTSTIQRSASTACANYWPVAFKGLSTSIRFQY